MAGKITTGVILAGSGVTLMARIAGVAGNLLTQASVSSISYQVTNLTLGQVAGSGTLTVSQVVFNSLVQNDPRWTADSASQPGADGLWGYNFLTTLPASIFPVSSVVSPPPLVAAAPQTYQVDIVFTPTSGQPFRVSYQAPVIPVYV